MRDYQALKALSAGGIHTLIEECPARFFYGSPWNPARVAENKVEFDIGTALHLAVLEPHEFAERVVLIEHDDYRTKEARDLRDGAWIAGKTPLKPKEYIIVRNMAEAIAARADIAPLFTGGDAEITLSWDWDGVSCKARPDYLSADEKIIVDAKTAASAHPSAIARKAFGEGWHIRAAWYREAVTAVCGVVPERYIFVVVEKDEPHLIQAFELDERAEEWGRQLIRAGLRRFEECFTTQCWPGYGESIMKIGLPAWAEYQLADRFEQGRVMLAP
jgi:hypothetical protein